MAHREGVWSVHEDRPPPRPFDGQRLAVEGGGVAIGAGLLACVASPFGLALPAFAVAAGFGAFGLVGRHTDDRTRDAREKVKSLREEFGAGPVWMVELLIRQGDAPTGRDQGLLWVEDGQIVFSGFRTSFALVPAQTAGTVRHEPGIVGVRHRLNLPLRRETAGGGLSLSFWPLTESLKRAENDAADLRYALNTALEMRGHRPSDEEGQWPPVALGPNAPAPRSLLVLALSRVALWVLVAALLAAPLTAWLPLAGVGLFLFIAIGANLAIRAENGVRWRAWHDRRRLG